MVQSSPNFPNIITLTEAAKNAIIKTLKNTKYKAVGVKLSLKTKGCSGLSWDLEIVREKVPYSDEVAVNDQYSLFIDKKAILFILGTKLDYVETDLESGFVFHNPKEKGKCGCGDSFYI